MSNDYAQIQISVVPGDALSFSADVLALKYAQQLFGVDAVVAKRLGSSGNNYELLKVEKGKVKLIDTYGSITANQILVIGVKWLYEFGYKDIREFSKRVLESLYDLAPHTKHIALTLHGAEYGLDETEAFESEIAGLIDAINRGKYPKALRQISVIEINKPRARRLSSALLDLLPKGFIETDLKAYNNEISPQISARLSAAGYESDAKPHIFIAMPFSKAMNDVYHYGIQGAVKAAGFVCERADLSTFTGDILSWIKKRIKSAALVIADLTDANPNVYLEVGYSWGNSIPTVLLAHNTSDLKFDVQGQRCIVYESIKDLEDALTIELRSLCNDDTNIEPSASGAL